MGKLTIHSHLLTIHFFFPAFKKTYVRIPVMRKEKGSELITSSLDLGILGILPIPFCSQKMKTPSIKAVKRNQIKKNFIEFNLSNLYFAVLYLILDHYFL